MMRRWLAAALIAVFGAFALPALAQDRLPVVASFSILADLAREVGGDRVIVRSLVEPDSDAHVYQPTPVDVRELHRASVLIMNGLGLEGWIGRLLTAAAFGGKTVIASDGIAPLSLKVLDERSRSLKYREVADPHAWQSVANVMIYVDNIERGLSEADPANAAYYAARAAAYRQRLVELDAWVKAEIGSVPPDKRRVITTHDAFRYFAAAYGVSFIAAEGLSTESDPSAQHIAALLTQIRQQRVRALFVENMSDPRLIAQLAKDGGAVLGGELYSDALSKPSGPAGSYIELMRHNVTQLKAGMLKN